MGHNDNQGGCAPRPADALGLLPGVDAHDAQERTESATEGVATGTPPAVGPSGLLGGASRAQQAAGVLGSFTVQNTETGREVVDSANAAAGGSDPFGDNSPASSVPWRMIALVVGVFISFVVAVQAFASGVGQGVVD